MKRTIILAFALILISGFIFAAGTAEQSRGHMGRYSEDWLAENAEKVTVTGAVTFKLGPHPIIVFENKEYELMVPYRYVTDLNVKEGDIVTVEGYAYNYQFCYDTDQNENEAHLLVTKALIGGKEYTAESFDSSWSGTGRENGLWWPHGNMGHGRR